MAELSTAGRDTLHVADASVVSYGAKLALHITAVPAADCGPG
jgi:hypothetical protein